MNRLAVISSFVFGGFLTANAETQPHLDQADRWVETRNGYTVEYSEGQEAYVAAAFEEMEKWAESVDEKLNELGGIDEALDPLILEKLRSRRDALLASIAVAIGIEEPTATMGTVYDKTLQLIELIGIFKKNLRENSVNPIAPRQCVVWDNLLLKEKLKAGEAIAPFTYDPGEDKFNYGFSFKATSTEAPVLAILLTEETEGVPPNEVVRKWISSVFGSVIEFMDEFPQRMGPDQGALCMHFVIHEAAEVGLGLSYMRSRDRRSALDGMAEYVSWKVARDLDGVEAANQVYPVASQLRRHAHLQADVDLVNWIASEYEKKEGFKYKTKNHRRAHYDFSSLAFFLLAQRYGDTALSEIWKETGKTSIKKASLSTVNDACKKVTGRELFDFYGEVETRPLDDILSELEILNSMPPSIPEPEFIEFTIDEIPIRYDQRIGISKGFLNEEISTLKAKLKQSLVKDRLADELKNTERLDEVHRLIWLLSRGRTVPRPNVTKYIEKLYQIDLSKLNPELVFSGLEIWDYEDTFTAMRAGKNFNAISFGEPYGTIVAPPHLPLVLKRESLRFRKWYI